MVNGIQAERRRIQVAERKKNNKKGGLESASFLRRAVNLVQSRDLAPLGAMLLTLKIVFHSIRNPVFILFSSFFIILHAHYRVS